MGEGEFAWTNLQTGEKWTFPDMKSLQAFLDARAARTSLAGSAEPSEKITTPEGEQGWPTPAEPPSYFPGGDN